jgi:hypothetical protein
MTQNRFYSSVALPTTLAAAISSPSATTISVNSVTGNPGSFPFTLLIDWGLPTQEAVSVTASSGTGPYTLTVVRGIDGTTAQTHVNGATVVHGVSAEDYNEPQVHIAASSGVHGLTGSVVGTTDTQTLTNKTLGATSYTGNITMSQSNATGNMVSITNTHSSPSNPNTSWIAAGVADLVLGISVSGDTIPRFELLSSGKIQWGAGGASAVDTNLYRASASTVQTDGALTVGTVLNATTAAYTASTGTGPVVTITNSTGTPTNPNQTIYSNSATDKALGVRVVGDTVSRLNILANGHIDWGPGGSTAVDTNLYRNAAGEAKTDNSMTVASNLTVGGAQLLAGGTGVLGVNNASVAPTSTPSGGAVVYGKSGYVKWRGTDGADYQTGSNISFVAAAGVNVTGTSPVTVTGLTAGLGVATYLVTLNLSYLPTGTIGSTSTFNFAFTGTTSTVALNWQIVQPGAASVAALYTSGSITSITSNMVSPTHVAQGAGLTISGIVIVSGAGTLTVTATDTTSADTITVNGGSYLEVQPIA